LSSSRPVAPRPSCVPRGWRCHRSLIADALTVASTPYPEPSHRSASQAHNLPQSSLRQAPLPSTEGIASARHKAASGGPSGASRLRRSYRGWDDACAHDPRHSDQRLRELARALWAHPMDARDRVFAARCRTSRTPPTGPTGRWRRFSSSFLYHSPVPTLVGR
jgi:hypothetical protein